MKNIIITFLIIIIWLFPAIISVANNQYSYLLYYLIWWMPAVVITSILEE